MNEQIEVRILALKPTCRNRQCKRAVGSQQYWPLQIHQTGRPLTRIGSDRAFRRGYTGLSWAQVFAGSNPAALTKMSKAPLLETGDCGFESRPVYQLGDECKAIEHAVFRTVHSGFESRCPFQKSAGIAKRTKVAVCKTANLRFKSGCPLQHSTFGRMQMSTTW